MFELIEGSAKVFSASFLPKGVIQVPAPCHYAHKLAYFVGTSIHQKPEPVLSDYLYYR